MGKLVDLTGRTFGRWTVLKRNQTIGVQIYWTCRCECGTEREVAGVSLRFERSLSCGCLNIELSRKRIAHGHTRRENGNKRKSRVYSIWQNMWARCTSPTHDNYRYYGGRGIRVCKRWDVFESFLSDMGEPPPGLTLDRIDNEGNYEQGNCRWATRKQQSANKRPFDSRGRPTGSSGYSK